MFGRRLAKVSCFGGAIVVAMLALTGGPAVARTGHRYGSQQSASAQSSSRPGQPTIEFIEPGNHELIVSVSVPNTPSPATSVTATCGPKKTKVTGAQPDEITVTGLQNGKKYGCNAFGTNASGKGPKSASVTARPARVVPSEPVITSVSPGAGSFTVIYNASAGFGSTVTGYTATCGSVRQTVNGSTLTITISGLTVDGSYTCTLYATDAKGNSTGTQWGGLAGPSEAPTIQSVLSHDGQLTIVYSRADNYALTYTVTCGTDSVTVNGNTNSGVPELWATVTGLIDGTTYPCSVIETNSAGNSPSSTAVSGTPNPIAGSPTSSSKGFFVAVSCPTSSECFAVGQGTSTSATVGLLETSTDGGATFVDHSVPTGTPQLKAIDCFDAMHCVAVGGSTALVTANGGATWSDEFAGWNLSAVSCVSDSMCVAGGYSFGDPTSVTTDGGAVWQAIVQAPELTDITCSSSNCIGLGYLVPDTYVSNDNGNTWKMVPFLDNGDQAPNSVSCLPSTSTCIMVGGDIRTSDVAAWMTTDDDQEWTSISSLFPPGASNTIGISCPTATTCFTLGGTVSAMTTDAGEQWSSVAGPDGPQPPWGKETIAGSQTLSCATATTCVVVGYNSAGAAAAFTTTSASSWTQSSIG